MVKYDQWSNMTTLLPALIPHPPVYRHIKLLKISLLSKLNRNRADVAWSLITCSSGINAIELKYSDGNVAKIYMEGRGENRLGISSYDPVHISEVENCLVGKIINASCSFYFLELEYEDKTKIESQYFKIGIDSKEFDHVDVSKDENLTRNLMGNITSAKHMSGSLSSADYVLNYEDGKKISG